MHVGKGYAFLFNICCLFIAFLQAVQMISWFLCFLPRILVRELFPKTWKCTLMTFMLLDQMTERIQNFGAFQIPSASSLTLSAVLNCRYQVYGNRVVSQCFNPELFSAFSRHCSSKDWPGSLMSSTGWQLLLWGFHNIDVAVWKR